MSSLLELQSAKVYLGKSGIEGTKGIFAVDDDKVVTFTNMKVGVYTVAAQPTASCLISVLATAVGTADTMGTLAVVGSLAGVAATESIVPIAGTTVYSANEYDTITSITGAGWVIDAGSGNDTIKIGVASAVSGDNYYFTAVQALADTVVASQTDVTGYTGTQLSDYTKIPEGVTVPCRCTKIALTSGEAIGYLARV